MSAPGNKNLSVGGGNETCSLTVPNDSSSGVQQGTILTKTLHVCVSGTLANLQMAGPSAGTWKLLDGKGTSVFGVGNEVDSQVATNQLRTALIHEVKLLQDRSTFPVALGVTINCIPSNEMTDLGERFAYTVLPQMQNTVGQVVYQCDVRTEEGMQVRFFCMYFLSFSIFF